MDAGKFLRGVALTCFSTKWVIGAICIAISEPDQHEADLEMMKQASTEIKTAIDS